MSVYENKTLQDKVTLQYAGRPGTYPAQAMNDEVSGVPFASSVADGTVIEFGTPVVWDTDGVRAVKSGDTNIFGVACFSYQVLTGQKGFAKNNLYKYLPIKRKGYVTVKMDTLQDAVVDAPVTLDASNKCYKLAGENDLVYGRIDTVYPEYGTVMIEMRNITAVSVAAKSAKGTLTFSANPSADDTVTIDETTYKFVSALAAANDVLIGTAKEDTAANLVAAINGAAGEGTLYGTGTVANEAVTATVATAVVTVTAAEAGTAGNSIVLTESSTAITASGSGTLAGGVDAQ